MKQMGTLAKTKLATSKGFGTLQERTEFPTPQGENIISLASHSLDTHVAFSFISIKKEFKIK